MRIRLRSAAAARTVRQRENPSEHEGPGL